METERLQLVRYKNDTHKQSFVALNTDPVVRKNMDGVHSEETATALWNKIIEENRMCWGVVHKTNEEYIGHAFLDTSESTENVELGFLFFSQQWGQGYATEVAKALVQHALQDLSCRSVIATVDNDNVASIRVLEKAGLQYVRQEEDELGPYLVYSSP